MGETVSEETGLQVEHELEDTGNYPDPDDGPQDEVNQDALPQFDDLLVDGADLTEAEVEA
jgi:hypothetical protein